MKPNFLSTDRISSLPDNIIETILCLVPIRDAVRTSILSKKWRYSWNQIPRLVFNEKDMFDELIVKDHKQDEDDEEQEDEDEDEDEVEEEEEVDEVQEEDEDEEEEEEEDEEEEEKRSVEEEDSEEEDMIMMWKREDKERKELIRKCKHFEAIHRRSKRFNAIHQVLLMHNGVISEFTLSMNLDNKCDEIDKIITYLSRKNTVKKFTLQLNGHDDPYKLPLSVFSLNQLTDLYLQQCDLPYLPTVNGFGSLKTLFLNNVKNTSSKMILHLVSKSPLLKRFSLVISRYYYVFNHDSVCELFGYLSEIQHLLFAIHYPLREFKSDLPELPTPLLHLKYVHLLDGCFIGKPSGFSFNVFLIRSSPNLEKLKLQSISYARFKTRSLVLEEYSDIWMEHLRKLEFVVAHQIPELKFVKLILAKSPVLKKVRIKLNHTVSEDDELDMLRVLSDPPPASQMVEIVVERLSHDGS